jgi:hypothetical protein
VSEDRAHGCKSSMASVHVQPTSAGGVLHQPDQASMRCELDRLAAMVNELTLRCVLEGLPLPDMRQCATVSADFGAQCLNLFNLMPWTDPRHCTAAPTNHSADGTLPCQSGARCTARSGVAPPLYFLNGNAQEHSSFHAKHM